MLRPLLMFAVLWAPVGALADEPGLWHHPQTTPMPGLPLGPFVHLDNGGLLTVSGDEAMISEDGGATEMRHPVFEDPVALELRPEAGLLRSREGTIILGLSNGAERVWKWNRERRDAEKVSTLPTYVVRSHDGGRTWDRPHIL